MRILTITLVLGFCAAPMLADWKPGDPYKMHFPQLPDPQGWDVNATSPKVLADDWLCTETGAVSDVHFWGSWYHDMIGKISSIHVSIHDNIPGPPYSQPGKLLWQRDFFPGQWVEKFAGTGPQGWYDPNTGFWAKPDHFQFFQYNIEGIKEPFIQEKGKLYWLDISVKPVDDPVITKWGWKTSYMHFEDDAVWGDFGTPGWKPLYDPITGQTLDMAFVITPEPASLVLLAFSGLMLVVRRR